MQARVWVHGNVAKGVWLVDPRLPLRTILIGKDKQLKVKGTPDCLASSQGIPTFEVLRTYERPQKAKFAVYNLTLLDQLVDLDVSPENRAKYHELIMQLQANCKAELSDLTKGPRSSERIKKVEDKLMQHQKSGGNEVDFKPSQMIAAGHE